jgi:uncharacterized membrane protein
VADSVNAWTDGTTLSAWVYDSPRGAAAGEVRLSRLRRRGAVDMADAVTVTWVPGAHRPRVGHTRSGPTDLPSDSPLARLLVRLTSPDDETCDIVSDLARKLCGSGLDEHFLRQLREALRPGSSALLVLSRHANLDDVQLVVERGRARGDVRLLYALLTNEALTILGADSSERSSSR